MYFPIFLSIHFFIEELLGISRKSHTIMSVQQTSDVGSQELEPESQQIPDSEPEQESEDEASNDNAEEEYCNNNNGKEVQHASPRGVLDMPADCSDPTLGTLSTATSVVHRALSPDNYGLPFRGFIDAVRNSSVKKLSTSTLALITRYDLSKRSVRRKLARIKGGEDVDLSLLPVMKHSWRNFEYAELASATDNFDPEKIIGKGGHAEVYKGCLGDGTVIAVKKLNKEDDLEEDTVTAFLSELGVIAHVHHRNAAKLVGFGVENGLYLVLQFAPCGSLATHLYGSREGLKWNVRYKVAVGVAQGLSYLHNTCRRRIIHRDIKASNILLLDDFEPIISDFGLAKWLPDNWVNHVVHPVEGTLGYLAPEYFMHGIVDEKTDVFAFGVVLLELLTGRHAVDCGHHALDDSRQSLVMWAKPLVDSNNVKELLDSQLGDEYCPMQLQRLMTTAAVCIHHEPCRRPHMNRVVEMIKGEGCPMERKQSSIHPRSMLLDACNAEGYTRSNYLQDLSRHQELLNE